MWRRRRPSPPLTLMVRCEWWTIIRKDTHDMSMYTTDPNFEDDFKVGDVIVLTNLQYVGKINTRHGDAEKVMVSLVTRESYPTVLTYSALGAGFANLARRASPGDFPHVAQYIRVPLPQGRQVKRFAPVTLNGQPLNPKQWVEGLDGDPVDANKFAPETGDSATPTQSNVATF